MSFASKMLPIVAVLLMCTVTRQTLADATELAGFYTASDQQATIDAAIDKAVAQMSFIKRPIARSRLKKTNPSYRTITITIAGEVLEIQFDDRKPIRMRDDGRPTEWTREDGEVFKVSAKQQERTLVQTFEAEDGERINTFSLGPAGRELSLQVTIKSPQLPTPVEYTLAFTRNTAN